MLEYQLDWIKNKDLLQMPCFFAQSQLALTVSTYDSLFNIPLMRNYSKLGEKAQKKSALSEDSFNMLHVEEARDFSDGNLMTNGYDKKLTCNILKSNKSAK